MTADRRSPVRRSRTTLVSLAALAALAPTSGCSEGDREPAVGPTVSPRWHEPEQQSGPAAPVLAAGLAICAGAGGELRAADAKSGTLGWTSDLGGASGRTPVADAERAYVVTEGGSVTSHRLASGEEIWKWSLGDEVTAGIALAEGRLFVVGPAGRVTSLDAVDGAELWTTELGAEIVVTPTATAGVLVVADLGGNLTRLDPETGGRQWQVAPDPTYVIGPPVIAGAVLVVPGYEDAVYGLSLADGETLWSHGGGNYVVALPVVLGDKAVFGTAQGPIHAVDLEAGSLAWRTDGVLDGRQAILVPWLDGLLVVDMGGQSTWLRAADGSILASEDLTLEIDAVASAPDDGVLVVSGGGTMHGFAVEWTRH